MNARRGGGSELCRGERPGWTRPCRPTRRREWVQLRFSLKSSLTIRGETLCCSTSPAVCATHLPVTHEYRCCGRFPSQFEPGARSTCLPTFRFDSARPKPRSGLRCSVASTGVKSAPNPCASFPLPQPFSLRVVPYPAPISRSSWASVVSSERRQSSRSSWSSEATSVVTPFSNLRLADQAVPWVRPGQRGAGRGHNRKGRAGPCLFACNDYCLRSSSLLFRRRALHLLTVDYDFFARLLAFAGISDGVWGLRENDRGEGCHGESSGYHSG